MSIFLVTLFAKPVEASFGGLVSAVITSGNEITVTYTHPLDNNVYTSYSNLGIGLAGRSITGGVGNTGDYSIVLTFDGPPVALNTTGTIDIDNTVTWNDVPGGFAGTTGWEVTDGQHPMLAPTILYSTSGMGSIKILSFIFLEPMSTTTITTSNIDSFLGLSNGHTFGTTGNGLELSWNNLGTILTVTMGTDYTVEEGDTVNPLEDVVDVAGNGVAIPGPVSILLSRPESRNLFYNAAVDSDWDTLGNWWNDEAFTEPASSIPNAYDSTFIYGDVSINSGAAPILDSLNVFGESTISIPMIVYNGAEFNNISVYLGSYLIGDVDFNDETAAGITDMGFIFSASHIIGNVVFHGPENANYGTITGNTQFFGFYGNAGLIFGNVEFHDVTSNPGMIIGNVDVYSPAENPLSGIISGTITYHGYDFDGGSGTSPEDPYLISTCTQLQNMKDNLDSYFQLTADIDCSETATWNENADEWIDGIVGGELIPDSYSVDLDTEVVVTNNGYYGFEPIGNDMDPFTGRLDGDGHTISNLWIFRKNSNQIGLFGETNGAHILRLGLTGSNIVGGADTGGLVGYVEGGEINDITLDNNMVRAYLNYNGGGLAGYIYGEAEVYDITNTGGAVHGSGSIIGGIVGRMEGATIHDSSSSADVDGGYAVGGFVGQMDSGTISESSTTGVVTSNRSENVFVKTGASTGGFVGFMTGGSINHSYTESEVNSSGDDAGGFVGQMTSGRIDYSHATGNVTGVQEEGYDWPSYVGGFGGWITGDGTILSYNYATGAVESEGNFIGGFGGLSGCSADISYSYASGNVSGHDWVGGFSGYDACEGPGSTLNKVSASGDVTGTGNNIGGFVGEMATSILYDGYASGDVVGVSHVGGFAGSINGGSEIYRAYSRGQVTASEPDNKYGFASIGGESSVTDSFFNIEITGDVTADGASPKTTEEMTTNSDLYTEADWDLNTVWRRENGVNEGYPFFAFVLEPQIVSVTPTDGATNVSTSTDITIQFSVPMETDYEPEISSAPCDESCPTYNMTWSEDGQMLTLVNSGDPFTYGTEYTISVISAKSRGGLYLQDTYEWSFTIEDEPTETVEPVIRHNSRKGGSSVQKRVKNLEAWGKTDSAETLKKQYPKVFKEDARTTIPTSMAGSNSNIRGIVRDLLYGITGGDVTTLQEFLISQNKGPASLALKNHGTTNYFGLLTKAAVAEWQNTNGVAPAVGYFGPKTRAKILELGL